MKQQQLKKKKTAKNNEHKFNDAADFGHKKSKGEKSNFNVPSSILINFLSSPHFSPSKVQT